MRRNSIRLRRRSFKESTVLGVNINPTKKFIEKYNIFQINLYDCIPTFVEQIKLKGITLDLENDIHSGTAILLNIAQRVFKTYNLQQSNDDSIISITKNFSFTQTVSFQKYNLINNVNDFVVLLSKFSNEHLATILECLLLHLTEDQLEILLNYIFKLEHIDNSDNFARGTSLAGHFIKTISAKIFSNTEDNYFNNYVLPSIKPIELLIEQNLNAFGVYSYNVRNSEENKRKTAIGENEFLDKTKNAQLVVALENYIWQLKQNKNKIPSIIKLICKVIDSLDFVNIKIKLLISGKPLDVVLENIVHNGLFTNIDKMVNIYYILILPRSDDGPKLYQIKKSSEIKTPILVDIDEIKGLRNAINKGHSNFELEKLLEDHQNSHLKFARKFGLINVRFFGYMITKRCEYLFNMTHEYGMIMNSALNILLIETMATLMFGSDKHSNVNEFFTSDNRNILKEIYTMEIIPDFINVKSTINSTTNSNTNSTRNSIRNSTTNADDFEDIKNIINLSINTMNDEYQVIYICLFVEVLSRFEILCNQILLESTKTFNRKSTNKTLKTNKASDIHTIAMNIKNKQKICLGDYLDSLDVVSDYIEKKQDSGATRLSSEILEMSLHYLFRTIISPFTFSTKNKLGNLYNRIDKMMHEEFSIFEAMIILNCITGSTMETKWHVFIERLRDIIQADISIKKQKTSYVVSSSSSSNINIASNANDVNNIKNKYQKYLIHVKNYLDANYTKDEIDEAQDNIHRELQSSPRQVDYDNIF